MKSIISFTLFLGWVAGFIIAKGWWAVLAFFVPFAAWYFVVEKLMLFWGVI